MKIFLQRFLLKGLAIIILLTLYSLTRLPQLTKTERETMAATFRFSEHPLYEPKSAAPKFVRAVHPQYKMISAWISSVGAGITWADIDGNGLCNDIIHVDPRFDKILISPAAGTSASYTPFELIPKTCEYDPSTMAPMGTLAYDFNNDGQTDILAYYWGRSPIIFYQEHNDFKEEELNPTVERWFTNAAILSDFDGDGQVDILITNYFPDGSRILDANASDNLQAMQHSMSRAYNGGTDHFFLFSGTISGRARYIEHNEWRSDIEHPDDWTLAVGAADIDGDQLPEVYFANDFGPDKFFQNLSSPGKLRFRLLKGTRRFTDIRSSVLGKDSFKGMGVSFADINNDGLLDIYVSNIAAEYALEESHFIFLNTGEFDKMKEGIAPFKNNSEKLGLSRSSWSWESRLADFNNDGVLEATQAVGFIKGEKDKWAELQELAMGNDELLAIPAMWPDFRPGTDLSGHGHNPFFVRSESGRYFDIAKEVGLNGSHVCRGIAVSDVDHDGDLDFATANQWEPSFFYRNDYNGKNNFIGLRVFSVFEGTREVRVDPENYKSAHFAIGADIKIQLTGDKCTHAFVDGGNGHSGKNSSEVLFGIGDFSSNDLLTITIRWRNTKGETLQKQLELKPGWHTLLLPY